ncbi:hypothetical protein T310_8961, partial [Rasamsonia emersonii CBS 393.64]
ATLPVRSARWRRSRAASRKLQLQSELVRSTSPSPGKARFDRRWIWTPSWAALTETTPPRPTSRSLPASRVPRAVKSSRTTTPAGSVVALGSLFAVMGVSTPITSPAWIPPLDPANPPRGRVVLPVVRDAEIVRLPSQQPFKGAATRLPAPGGNPGLLPGRADRAGRGV